MRKPNLWDCLAMMHGRLVPELLDRLDRLEAEVKELKARPTTVINYPAVEPLINPAPYMLPITWTLHTTSGHRPEDDDGEDYATLYNVA